jgi:hypothetical protein
MFVVGCLRSGWELLEGDLFRGLKIGLVKLN